MIENPDWQYFKKLIVRVLFVDAGYRDNLE